MAVSSPGTSEGITASGGGYGGTGGQYTSDQSTADIAGPWYGLTRDPVDMGSGGGGAEGGAGGAFLYLRVYETLTLEGRKYVLLIQITNELRVKFSKSPK